MTKREGRRYTIMFQ